MLTNPATRNAFDIKDEPESVRKLYGPGHRGELYMLGRKLIESSVRFVCVNTQWPSDGKVYPGGGNMNWDHHDAIYSQTHTNIPGGGAGGGRYGIGTWPMMQSTGWAFSGLIQDMDQRGLLKDTLVCFVTEFGRTPKINERKGRDHWVHTFTYLFAGGGSLGEYGELTRVDTAAGSVKPLAVFEDMVLGVAISPDGKFIASGGADNGLRGFDFDSGKFLWKSDQHSDWVTSVDFTPYRFAEETLANKDVPGFVKFNEDEQKAGEHPLREWIFETGWILHEANWELSVKDDKVGSAK